MAGEKLAEAIYHVAYIRETFRLMVEGRAVKGPLATRLETADWRAKAVQDTLAALSQRPTMTSPEDMEGVKADFALVSQAFPAPWSRDERTSWIWSRSLKGGHAHMADVRGWGYLTGSGHGALGLSESEAVEIQNALGRLIAAIPDLVAALSQGGRGDG